MGREKLDRQGAGKEKMHFPAPFLQPMPQPQLLEAASYARPSFGFADAQYTLSCKY
jgi:hypothetical protein